MTAHGRLGNDDRVIAVVPFFDIYGLVVPMNLSLYRCATVATMPRFDLAQLHWVVATSRATSGSTRAA
jgi:acyl-CoA synthetase (AMP-forming)/AMP-acid ligase II